MDASTLHPECTLGRQTPVCRQLGHEAAFRADQGLRTRHGHRRLGNVVLSASLSGGRQWPTTVCCGHLSQMDTPHRANLYAKRFRVGACWIGAGIDRYEDELGPVFTRVHRREGPAAPRGSRARTHGTTISQPTWPGVPGVTLRNGNNRTLSDSRRLGKRRVGVNPSLTSGTGC